MPGTEYFSAKIGITRQRRMHSLVYVSSAVRLFSPEDLLDLLVGSRERNAKRGVTGMLLYKGGNFMQVLEGKDRTVSALFNKIAKDPRHRNLEMLIEEDVQQRQFAEDSMAFRNLDALEAAALPGYSPFLNEPLNSKRFFPIPPRLKKLLLMFKGTM